MELFKSKHMPSKVKYKNKIGKVVGCYVCPYWHKYMFKAFHVEFKNGTRKTLLAKSVKKL